VSAVFDARSTPQRVVFGPPRGAGSNDVRISVPRGAQIVLSGAHLVLDRHETLLILGSSASPTSNSRTGICVPVHGRGRAAGVAI